MSFLGCAPSLPLKPEEGDGYLRISLPVLDAPTLFVSKNVRPVICPACNARIDRWVDNIVLAKAPVVDCPQCKKVTSLQKFNLRKRACFTRTIIQILPVFEAEAVPADFFVNSLNQEFDASFKVAFIQA
jgi:hypothetical protein